MALDLTNATGSLTQASPSCTLPHRIQQRRWRRHLSRSEHRLDAFSESRILDDPRDLDHLRRLCHRLLKRQGKHRLARLRWLVFSPPFVPGLNIPRLGATVEGLVVPVEDVDVAVERVVVVILPIELAEIASFRWNPLRARPPSRSSPPSIIR
ncbi:hypothetical protein GW17_00051495 [Ensete ventricosum]|nr:hypothetical protein GW17_00051495 [Ensete ventricosum]